MLSYQELRKEYPEFIYRGYNIEENNEKIRIEYDFEIPGLSKFAPTWEFPKKNDSSLEYKNNKLFENMVFSLGMVELVSYWKITCSPKVRVLAGKLDNEQKKWWKSLYFNGLGEFYYTNGIEENEEAFMDIISEGKDIVNTKEELEKLSLKKNKGCLIPIGGGKDSAVTLSLLKSSKKDNYCYIINPRGATLNTVEKGGYADNSTVAVKRTLDKNMLELNKQGFLNGHTPFSAIVAFSATIAAYLFNLKYIVLSNESSANESTVEGSYVNHQYSKSFQFEKDFHEYEAKYILSGTYYFSMLRPLSEFQIAKIFAGFTQYHDIFRSCNAGSKQDIWCGHCPKCLFVYLIMSPFIKQDRLVEIFGRNMLEDEEMMKYFDQLIGVEKEKPFECVGSRDEINTAICLTIDEMKKSGTALPLLFEHYMETGLFMSYEDRECPYFTHYDQENLLPEEFEKILKEACF